MSDLSDAEVLRAAAHHVSKVGLTKEGGFFAGDADPSFNVIGKAGDRDITDVPCCALGGVHIALGATLARHLSYNYTNAQYIRVNTLLNDYIEQQGIVLEFHNVWSGETGPWSYTPDITEYSDHPGTTPEDVSKLLLGAAIYADALAVAE